jgi:hypothetical protein
MNYTYIRHGHNVIINANELSTSDRQMLTSHNLLSADGTLIHAKIIKGRWYYKARLQKGYRWSSPGKYPEPVRK